MTYVKLSLFAQDSLKRLPDLDSTFITRPLTDRAIDNYMRAGRYGPIAQARILARDGVESAGESCLLRGWRYNGVIDRKSTRLNSSHSAKSRMPSSA